MYEYKLTAVPTRGRPQKSRRGLHEAFGVAIEEKMNKMIHDGWDFVEFRDVPVIERRVLRANVERTATMMLFKRSKSQPATAPHIRQTHRPQSRIDLSHEDISLVDELDLDQIPSAIKKMMRRRERRLHNLPLEITEKPN